MGRVAVKSLALLAGVFALWGCQPMPSDTLLTDSKVVSIGKTHLILDDGKSILFVTIDESDKENLKDIRKGDKVILVSKKSEDDERSVDVVELITADGRHIPLGS